MCGIGGGFALRAGVRVDPGRLGAMAAAMQHRGPDGEGYWMHPSGQVGLVHRRLAIIDLVTGRQPLTLGDDSGVIVLNGEIYNYLELREKLRERGGEFSTRSDTEVLLRAYWEDGPNCLGLLRGMFAFAIWDERSRELFMARDRVGKKPLFYTIDEGCLYFASTLVALLSGSSSRGEVDLQAVDRFLDLGYIPSPDCIWKGISKLPAAHWMRVDSGGIHLERYWDLADNTTLYRGSFESAVDRLQELIQDAVLLRLRSDVPLGVFLSGGIDSSLVAAVSVEQSVGSVQTFSIGFSEGEFDERPYARDVATRLNTEHHSFSGNPRMLAILPEVVRHFGEPFGDSSCLNVWFLAHETRQHVTVALGGDGGDEGFAGYPWYHTFFQIQRWRNLLTPLGANLALRAVEDSRLSSPKVARLRRALRAVAAAPSARFGIQRSFLGPDEVNSLYAGELRGARVESVNTAPDWLAGLWEGASGTPLHRMRSVDILSYLADCLMPKVDVGTMAHGLEARAPLLDHRVLEFASSLPDPWLTDGGVGKVILRALLDRYLPRELFDRPKMGFSLPLDPWFSTGADGVLDQVTRESALLDTGWFDPQGILDLVCEHRRRIRDHSQRLYNLLVLNEWLRQYWH